MRAAASEPNRTSEGPGPAITVVIGLLLVTAALFGRTLGDDVRLAEDRALLASSAAGLEAGTLSGTAFVPILEASYAIDRALDSPTATHALQLVLVWLASCGVFALARRLGAARAPAAIGAILVLAHPLVAESSALLAARGSLLAIVLLVLAVERFLRWRETGGAVACVTGIAFGLAAALSHPLGSIVAPLAFVIVSRRAESTSGAGLAKAGVALAFLLAGLQVVLTIRGGFDRVIDRAALAGLTLRDLFVPFDPAAAYAMPGNAGQVAALSIAVLVVALALSMRVAMRGGAIALAVHGVVVAFVAMVLFDPTPLAAEPTFADRSTAVVVAWLGVLAGSMLGKIWATDAAPARVGAVAASAVVVVVLGAQTFARALDFESDVRRFEAAVRVAPDAPAVRERLGNAWLDRARQDPAKTPPQERERRLRRAAEELGRALDGYEAIGAAGGERIELRSRLAEVLGELGLDERALEEVDRALRALEDRTGEPGAEVRLADAYRLRGRLHESAGDIDRAERDFRAAVEHHETADALFESGRLAVDRGARLEGAERGAGRDFVEAGLRDLDRALELDPARLDARLEKARGLVALRQYIRAVTVLEDAIERHPESPRPRYELASTYLRVDDYKGAGTHVTEALKLDPRHVDSLLLMARILRASGKQDQADRAIQNAYVVHPSREDVRIAWAEVRGRQAAVALDAGQADQAILLAREAMRIDEGAPAPWIVVADAHVSKREYDDAREELERAYRLFPGETMRRELAMMCRDAGYAFLLADDRPRALGFFRRAVELLPHEPDFSILHEILSNE